MATKKIEKLTPAQELELPRFRAEWLAHGRYNHLGECPQGQFLLHHLPNGFTAIAWWDRTQAG